MALARKKDALILAHYYQSPQIQEVADFIGDSLELSRVAEAATNEIIVFCGVRFMAETAKLLNPEKLVLLPDLSAGCSLADNCSPDLFARFLENYTDHFVVSYINCSAEVKAMSDIICTSSNAESIVSKVPKGRKIVFAPDANLGRYIIKKTGRELVLWDGACVVHEAFSIERLIATMQKFPHAELIAHPESEEHILKLAGFIGSTKRMIDYVKTSKRSAFIIATEAGILHKMQQEAPDKVLVAAPSHEDNTCACSECAFMKVNTLEKLHQCLLNETPAIELDSRLVKQASAPLIRMLEWS